MSRCMLEAGTVSFPSACLQDWLTISADRMVWILNEGRNEVRHVKVALMRSSEAFVQGMAFCAQGSVAFLCTHEASMNIKHVMLQGEKAHLRRVHERFRGCTGLRDTGLVRHRRRVRIPMDQGMPRSSPFDFAKASEIASSEVAVSVLEFPQRRVRRAMMEDITD